MIVCTCHEELLDLYERAWLKEDGTVLCDDGHMDEQHDDPFDREDHGTPYTARSLITMNPKQIKEREAEEAIARASAESATDKTPTMRFGAVVPGGLTHLAGRRS